MPDVTLTDAQLDEIEARAKAATEEPWRSMGIVPSFEGASAVVDSPEGYIVRAFTPNGPQGCRSRARPLDEALANTAFIAHARTDVPTLIAALRASRERELRLEAALKEIVEDCACPCASHRIAYAALDEEAT